MKDKTITLIKKLELELLNPLVRKDKKRLNELLSDDFIEFTSTGLITNKIETIKKLPKLPKIDWKASNIKVRQITEDVVLVNFNLKKKNLVDGKISFSLRSSIWKFNGKSWKMVFHQGTLL